MAEQPPKTPDETAPTPIAIIAGAGGFATTVQNTADKHWSPVLIALKHCADPQTKKKAITTVSIGQWGKLKRALKDHKINHITFAGKMPRPKWHELQCDALGLKNLIAGLIAIASRDNAALMSISQRLENALGVSVVALETIAPALVARQTPHPHPTVSNTDLDHALLACKAFGKTDKGQSLLWHDKKVIATEGKHGTTHMIKTAKSCPKNTVFVKAAKPQQDLKNDMPAFGLETLEALNKAGINTALLEADHVIFTSPKDDIFKRAKEQGISVIVKPSPKGNGDV